MLKSVILNKITMTSPDDYKFEQRKRKRGEHCVFSFTDQNGVGRSCLCGCGSRTPPNKKHKTRIVKRSLKKAFLRELKDFDGIKSD